MSTDFQLLDSGEFYKLEQVGPYIFHRPSPAAVWPKSPNPCYKKVDAHFERFKNGKGKWTFNTKVPESFEISILDFKLQMKTTSFGHLGAFFEQHINWQRLLDHVESEDRVLNLFAYTGVASLAAAATGAQVTHVDASKSSVTWAKKNQELSNMKEARIKWIVEDVRSFVAREIRRNNKYEWILLDPPSFGRGSKNESWIIEQDMIPLIQQLSQLKSDRFKGVLLSSHSPGYNATSLDHILRLCGFNEKNSLPEEMLIPHPECPLPSGFSSWRHNLNLL